MVRNPHRARILALGCVLRLSAAIVYHLLQQRRCRQKLTLE